jgi:hypothetical protein
VLALAVELVTQALELVTRHAIVDDVSLSLSLETVHPPYLRRAVGGYDEVVLK